MTNKIFKSARIKLTGWYLLIIMIITFFFSSFIYRSVMNDVQRAFRVHQRNYEMRIHKDPSKFDPEEMEDLVNSVRQAVEEVRKNTIRELLILNITILIISGGLSYILAGLTLKPIEQMHNKQKKFIGDAAHELKTPLTAMKTNIEVNLRNKKLNFKDAKDVLSDTLGDIDNLSYLTNTLINTSRYEDQTDKSTFVNVNIKALINIVLQKFDTSIKEKKIKVTTKLIEEEIFANENAMKELFTILIDNAIKFNKKDGEIKIKMIKDKKHLVIKIRDTGIGIKEDDIPYLFDRFYKVDDSRSKNENEGFGLGLSIAREIVNDNKGSISVDSKINKYTEFTINFPI